MTRSYCSKRAMLALSFLASIITAAQAQITPAPIDPSEGRAAYNRAIICFLANGHARGLRERAGDKAKATIYEAHAHESWSVAFQLGQTLGFPNDRIEQDISRLQADELPAMVKDEKVFFSDVAMCKAVGLM